MGALDKFSHARPHRGLGRPITALIHCPLCDAGGATPSEVEFNDWGEQRTTEPDVPLRIISYRPNAVRLACPACGLRFSVPLGGDYGLRAALEQLSDGVILRAKRVIYALDPAAAARLEQRIRGRSDFDSAMDAGVIEQVTRRLGNAEAKARELTGHVDRDELRERSRSSRS
jgi:hypothetical protein